MKKYSSPCFSPNRQTQPVNKSTSKLPTPCKPSINRDITKVLPDNIVMDKLRSGYYSGGHFLIKPFNVSTSNECIIKMTIAQLVQVDEAEGYFRTVKSIIDGNLFATVAITISIWINPMNGNTVSVAEFTITGLTDSEYALLSLY